MASRSERTWIRVTAAGLARAAAPLLVLSLAASCLPDGEMKHRGPVVPEALDDGWEIATPASVGLDEAALAELQDQLLREDRSFGTLGVLIVKDGKLVWETYLRDLSDRDHYHHLQSSTKSVTSLALGAAIGEGHFPDLDATLGELLPDAVRGLDPRKAEITLEELLTMRSGIAFDNDVFSVEMWVDKPSDPLRYILNKPMYADPGERFYYRDADPQLLGYVLQHELGMSEARFVKQRIFDPLGVEDYYWESGHDGVTQAAHGLHLRPRDFAKLGQLLLDGCRWHGEQLVPEAYCETATREHVSPKQVGHISDAVPLGYGYYFWVPSDDDVFSTWGHGGQFVLVVPARDMVLVQIALPDTDGDLHGTRLEDFVQLTAPLWR